VELVYEADTASAIIAFARRQDWSPDQKLHVELTTTIADVSGGEVTCDVATLMKWRWRRSALPAGRAAAVQAPARRRPEALEEVLRSLRAAVDVAVAEGDLQKSSATALMLSLHELLERARRTRSRYGQVRLLAHDLPEVGP
jgi:hypothetical protein